MDTWTARVHLLVVVVVVVTRQFRFQQWLPESDSGDPSPPSSTPKITSGSLLFPPSSSLSGFSSFLRPATARGGLHSSYPPGFEFGPRAGSSRQLFEDKESQTRKDYFACPDDETFRFLASVYSCSHYNMSLRKEFEGGITNRAFWYPIYGGMQDWNYENGGCFELTLEISDNKWPTANEKTVSRSSTEAEYRQLAYTAAELPWLCS
ncbi:unnamed protein product [Malus baccata var. baccata]